MALSIHAKIAIGWIVVSAIGIYSFTLSKNKVISNRYKDMKRREELQKRLNKEVEDKLYSHN